MANNLGFFEQFKYKKSRDDVSAVAHSAMITAECNIQGVKPEMRSDASAVAHCSKIKAENSTCDDLDPEMHRQLTPSKKLKTKANDKEFFALKKQRLVSGKKCVTKQTVKTITPPPQHSSDEPVISPTTRWRERFCSVSPAEFEGRLPCTAHKERPLRLLIIGHNPSEHSYTSGTPYSNPSNRFWPTMRASGILPEQWRQGPCPGRVRRVGAGWADKDDTGRVTCRVRG